MIRTSDEYFVIVLALVFLIGCLTSCERGETSTVHENSRLYKDLTGDHRDSIFRAILFIDKIRGTSTEQHLVKTDAGDSDGLEYWKKVRKPYVRWLRNQEQDFFEKIAPSYEEFWETWSPYFD